MTLNGVEELAKYVRNVRGQVPPINAKVDLINLAEAVLLLLPVVRAAEAWNDDPDGRLKTGTDFRLQDALEEMWAAMREDA